MFKRVVLFILTNLAVLLVLSVVARLLGLDQLLARYGQGMQGLLIYAAIFGFGGALISLSLSKWTAKRMMGVAVITSPSSSREQWLVNTVGKLAQQAGIGMPEVGIFQSPQPNAFATGARLAGRGNMVAALERLKQAHDQDLPQQMAAFGIAGGVRGGLARLFMSHPPLDERIAALQSAG